MKLYLVCHASESYQLLTYQLSDETDGMNVAIMLKNPGKRKRRQHAKESWMPVLDGL